LERLAEQRGLDIDVGRARRPEGHSGRSSRARTRGACAGAGLASADGCCSHHSIAATRGGTVGGAAHRGSLSRGRNPPERLGCAARPPAG
jgi:hypothetical protein